MAGLPSPRALAHSTVVEPITFGTGVASRFRPRKSRQKQGNAMRVLVRWTAAAGVMLAGLSFAGTAGATVITMNFDPLTTGQAVADYYNGGCSTSGGHAATCGGPANGVTWSGASQLATGTGNSNVLSFGGIATTTMTVAGGFTRLSFDFNYDFLGFFGVIFYSGTNGTGTTIASSPATWAFGSCPSGGSLDCHADITLATSAQSARFWVVGLGLASLDNVTVQSTSVPEPAALGTFGFGLLLVGGLVAWRRREGDAARQAT